MEGDQVNGNRFSEVYVVEEYEDVEQYSDEIDGQSDAMYGDNISVLNDSASLLRLTDVVNRAVSEMAFEKEIK
jgi:hypothetical protein